MKNLLSRFKNFSNKTKLLLALFVLFVLFTRLFNLDHTARFTQDESSDLSRMYQYWQQKKISFVGPISNDGSKVFSSLTYYMVMPFAAATEFKPVGPVYGTAFWGVITAFLLLWIAYKLRPEWIVPLGVLIVVWYPLLEMSRWAWNPHFVAFWGAIGILAYLYRERFGFPAYFVIGMAFGLTFHHHYLSVFATAPFMAYIGIELLRKKQFVSLVSLSVGYVGAYLPFLLFDLRHPPGLFFGKYLVAGNTPHVEKEMSVTKLLAHLWRNYAVFIDALVKPLLLKILLGFALPVLAFLDIRSKKFNLVIWFIPTIISLIGGVILDDYQVRYIYPTLIFIFIWFLMKREQAKAQLFVFFSVVIILAGSLITVIPQLWVTKVPPDMYSLTLMSQYIEQTIRDKKVVNPNVAVVASPDSAPLAEKYRDLISMRGVALRAPSEYGLSENLFAITTSSYEQLRADESYAIGAFKNANLKGTYQVPNSEWRVYWIGYGEL